MTIKAISLALVAAVTAGAAATPTFARDYGYDRAYASNQGYDRSYHDSCRSQGGAAAGTIIGALAGAIFGSNVAGHGAKSEGGVIGAVAGGVIGNRIGHSADNSNCDRSHYGYSDRYRRDGRI